MRKVIAFGVVAMVAGCGDHSTASTAAAGSGSADSICDRYLHHVDELGHTSSYATSIGGADYAFCQQHTSEQLACSLAATTLDDEALCEQFSDPTRRALGRTLTAQIRPRWPGSAALPKVLASTGGCAFAGVLGQDRLPLTDSTAVVAFALRDAGTTGDATTIIATLARQADGNWSCTATDPDGQCDVLERACRPRT